MKPLIVGRETGGDSGRIGTKVPQKIMVPAAECGIFICFVFPFW